MTTKREQAREQIVQSLRSISDYKNAVLALHSRWFPHPSQIKIGRAVFQDSCRVIFIQAGRRLGKTEIVAYINWRKCLTSPGSECYIIGPQRKQIAEILWASKRIQNFGPRELLLDGDRAFNKSELRVNFKNGSFIKLDGADNAEALRGITPDLMSYDEFKDFSEEFHIAIEPSFLTKRAPLVIIGTPPDRECFYTKYRTNVLREVKRGNKEFAYFEFPTSANPYVLKKDLLEKKRQLYENGESAVWLREYMAKYVPGGVNAIFPMFSQHKHVRPIRDIEEIIKRDRKKMNWYCICDPGTTTCFGMLFIAVHPYTKQVFVLDEVYERDRMRTSTDLMWGKAEKIMDRYWDRPDDWQLVYDNAAAWFATEVLARYGRNLTPTQKQTQKKEDGLSLMKDVMRQKHGLFIASHCVYLMSEIQNYVTDDEGKIPKKDDHLIDCFRYMLSHSCYQLNKTDPEGEDKEFERYKLTRKDFHDMATQSDWTRMADQQGAIFDEDTGEVWIM